MRPNKARLRKWVEALRSGKYKQGKHLLRKKVNQHASLYCCLGVMCEVAMEGGMGQRSLNGMSFPTYDILEWFGLNEANHMDPLLDFEDGHQWKASYANDIKRMTFLQIADAIERTFELGES